jgi:nicotinamide-nucleotide amidase
VITSPSQSVAEQVSSASLKEQTLAVAAQLGASLGHHKWMLSTAESCTGGLLAGAITAIAGSSAWFDRGFVTYSNAAKIAELSVPEETLVRFGAVSEEVALEMANGVLLAAPHAHVAMSTTGIAGPDGGTAGKPVGLVCFGFAMRTAKGITSRAMTHVFDGNREQVREAAVLYALRGLLEFMGEPVSA